MPTFVYFSEELLQPISADLPCGVDLRYDPVFTEIAEARRSDEESSEGEWRKEGGPKVAEWARVADLSINALRHRTKDLRIAGYLTEAAVRLDGYFGLRDCLHLTTELLRRFWDKGVFPAIDDGDLGYRASAFVWLDNRIPEMIGPLPLTARAGAENYGHTRYLQAKTIGSEAAMSGASGDKKETIQGYLRQGWITSDQFQAALDASKLEGLEAIFEPVDQVYQSLIELVSVVDERFGADAPSLSTARETIATIREMLSREIKKKKDSHSQPPAPGATPNGPVIGGSAPAVVTARTGVLPTPLGGLSTTGIQAWEDAEALVRAGSIEQGLAQMAGLAAQELCDRDRFLRKLMLSDVCLRNGRERLARTVLEELNQKIEEFKLERWESSGLVGAVWSRLYKLYRKTGENSDLDRAAQLYNRLCHLDPWQAYISCED